MPLIIDDHNYSQYLGDDPFHCGGEKRLCTVKPRDWNAKPYGSVGVKAEEKIQRIPYQDWPDAIADQQRNKSSMHDLWEQSPIGTLDQNGISYCHAFSFADAAMIVREQMGLPYEELSASSIGGPITGWQNEGAYIEQDLRQGVKYGIASTKFVPMLTTKERDAKPGWLEDAANHKVVEYWEGRPGDYELMGSALLKGFVVCIGYNWWGHAVTGLRLVLESVSIIRQAFAYAAQLPEELRATYVASAIADLDILNSWGRGWGEKGVGRLRGQRKIPNEWYVIRQMTNYRAPAEPHLALAT